MTETFRVEPVESPIRARVRPPGSKSISIRALAAAALAEGRSHLYGMLHADDTTAMVGALRSLGVDVDDSDEPWSVDGNGGYLHTETGTIDAIESGLTARIAMVLAAFTETTTTITGQGRLLERPIDDLVDVLDSQGVSVQTTDGHLPVTINGQGGLWGGPIEVDCSKSSQFATAVLLAAPAMSRPASIRLLGLSGSAGYLDVTLAVMGSFGARVSRTITGFEVEASGYQPADFLVEPDASAAVYPMVAAAITGGRIEIEGLSMASKQPDIKIARHLADMGCDVEEIDAGMVITGPDRLEGISADLSESPDGALALAVACAFAGSESHLSGLHSLQFKESDRLKAISVELQKLGVAISVEEDGLRIEPGEMHGAKVDPHGDHRIAMAVAVAGLRVEGVEISAPRVVEKTWPGYWEWISSLSVI